MIKSNSGFNQFGFGKSTIWLIRGGLALYLPSASVQTALSSSPYYRPEGLQGTNRFGAQSPPRSLAFSDFSTKKRLAMGQPVANILPEAQMPIKKIGAPLHPFVNFKSNTMKNTSQR